MTEEEDGEQRPSPQSAQGTPPDPQPSPEHSAPRGTESVRGSGSGSGSGSEGGLGGRAEGGDGAGGGPEGGGSRGAGPRGAGPAGAGAAEPPGGVPGGSSSGAPGDASGGEPGKGRLTRSRSPKTVAGVCSGLGRYFDLDPVVFKVPLVVLSLVGGLGLVFYGAAWLLIPAEGERQNEARWLLSGRVEGTTLSAILVALVGCGLFLASLGSHSTPFSLLLVAAVGGAAYWSLHRREAKAAEAVGAPVDPTTAHAVADAPPEAQAPPVPGTPSWWRDPVTKGGAGGLHGTGYLWGPADAAAGAAGPPPERSGGHTGCARGAGDGRRRERSFGGSVAMLASLAALAGAVPGWDSRPLGTSLTVGLACALAVYGIGFAVSAFVGRLGPGTVFLTLVTAVLLGGAALVPRSIGTDWREVTWAPAAASDVSRTYELDGGAAELDLSGLKTSDDPETVRTAARMGVGSVKVLVPSRMRVELAADVAAGEIRVPRPSGAGEGYAVQSLSGLGRNERMTLLPSGDGREDGGTLELSADLTIGQLEIVRVLPSGERTDHLPAEPAPHDGLGGERP